MVEENNHEIINDSIPCGILLTIGKFSQFIPGIICVDWFHQMALPPITRIRVKYFECDKWSDGMMLMMVTVTWPHASQSTSNLQNSIQI